MVILSLIGIIFSIIIGYWRPVRLGWIVFMVEPLLGPNRFTLIPSLMLPLNIDRIAFFLTLGILFRFLNRKFPFKKILKSKTIVFAVIFSLFYLIVSAQELFFYFTYLPNMFFAFVLPFLVIRDKKDIFRLSQIFYFHTIIISLFILLEYTTGFNIALTIMKTNPTVNPGTLYTGDILESMAEGRGGQFRVAGLFGHPVNTGFRMAFLLPISLWYAIKKGPIHKIIFSFILFSFILLQTRMAILSFMLSLFIIFRKLSVKYFFIAIFSLFVILFTFYLIPFTNDFIQLFWSSSFSDLLDFSNDPYTISRIVRILSGIQLFVNNPIYGYGSPGYVYYELLGSADINSPLIYLLSGGIGMFIMYLGIILSILISTNKITKLKFIARREKDFINFIFAGFFAGFFVVLSNWTEDHFLIIFIMYMAIYKAYYFLPKISIQYLQEKSNILA